MPVKDGIEVSILIDDEPAIEYAKIEEGEQDEYKIVRYIEVETGQSFAVQTQWLAGFEINSADYLYTSCTMDDNDTCRYDYCETDELSQTDGRLDEPHVETMERTSRKNPTTNKWESVWPTFGAVELDENIKDDVAPNDTTPLVGSIRVTVHRAQRIKRRKPYVWKGNLPSSREAVSEKLMEGRGVKNIIAYREAFPTYEPEPEYYDYSPLDEGQKGAEIYEFIFLYRSRESLKKLGVIARTPSPAPDVATMLEETEQTLKIVKASERKLQLEVEDMKTQWKQFISSQTSSTRKRISKPHKRGRSNTDDDLTELPPPPKKPVVTIDLTEDN